MKILMISRSTLMSSVGGDTVQVIETASHLRRLGVEIDIMLANDVIEYGKYDLIHFFNIIRPSDILIHIRKSQLPFVVSTIFVDYSESNKFQFNGIMGRIFNQLSPDFVEYLKVIIRSIVNREKINSLEYLFYGHYRSVRKILNTASILLPNSKSENDRLIKRYDIDQKFKVIPNAINLEIFKDFQNGDRAGILCVGRIEPRKNQLSLIKALKHLPYKLLIIGNHSPNHLHYFDECKNAASENVSFIEHMDQKELSVLYSKSKVHVLPSWFETTGLSSLESAACGCNLVITAKGDTVEYFGDYAFYCDPGSVDSIRQAVIRAYEAEINYPFIELVRNKYNWNETARLTLDAYKEMLS